MRNQLRRGFSLVELTISVGVAAMLVVGLSSALVVATRSVDPPTAIAEAQDGADVVRQLVEDAQHAIYILERTDTTFEFALSDMNGDNSPDIVRYEWDGSTGSDLTRSLNGGTAAVIATNVHAFDLDYFERVKTESIPGPLVTSNESVLSSITSGSSSDDNIENSKWWGQHFEPEFPPGISPVSWQITKVEFCLGRTTFYFDSFKIGLHEAAGGVPASTAINSMTGYEYHLSSNPSWKSYNLTANNLDPNKAYCLVLERLSGIYSAEVRYRSGGEGDPQKWLLESDNQGSSWDTTNDKGLYYKVYGKYTYAGGGNLDVDRKYLTGVRATLQLGAGSDAEVIASAPLLNTPESVVDAWQLDFDVDPTTQDVNYDDVDDWAVSPSGTFDTNQLSNGVWNVTQVLGSRPLKDFLAPVTVNARLRATSTGGSGGGVMVRFDQSGSNLHSTISVNVVRESNGTQTVKLFKQTDTTVWEEIAASGNFGLGFVDVRVVIQPAVDYVALYADNQFIGVYPVAQFWDTSQPREVALYEYQAQAEFDYVSIRVSETN